MKIRHKPHLISKQNSNLLYFANVHIAANMAELTETAGTFFDKECTVNLILMTPIELNSLLDEARRQGRAGQ